MVRIIRQEIQNRSVCHRVDFPSNRLSREYRAVYADALISAVARGLVCFDCHHAADAHAEAAAHRGFERDKTICAEVCGYLGNALHHHPRAAGIDARARAARFAEMSFERRGHKTSLAQAPVIRGDCERKIERAKIFEPAPAGYARAGRAKKYLSLYLRLSKLAAKRQDRGRAYAAGDHDRATG